MKGRFLTDSNTQRNLCYFLLIKEIDSSFSATLLEIAYSFNSSFIFQLLSIFKFPHQTGICKLLFVTFYDYSIYRYLYPTFLRNFIAIQMPFKRREKFFTSDKQQTTEDKIFLKNIAQLYPYSK